MFIVTANFAGENIQIGIQVMRAKDLPTQISRRVEVGHAYLQFFFQIRKLKCLKYNEIIHYHCSENFLFT